MDGLREKQYDRLTPKLQAQWRRMEKIADVPIKWIAEAMDGSLIFNINPVTTAQRHTARDALNSKNITFGTKIAKNGKPVKGWGTSKLKN